MNCSRNNNSHIKQECFKQEPSQDSPEDLTAKALNHKSCNHIDTLCEELDTRDNNTNKPAKASSDKDFDWPEKDVTKLIRRMERAIPEDDNLVYSTRVEKLNWDSVKFKSYSGDECKKAWLAIQKKLRRYRCLGELLQDAKEWFSKPLSNSPQQKKALQKNYPDMPSRPLSAYNLYFLEKKNEILSGNPEMDVTELSKSISQMYKTVTLEEKQRYKRLAGHERRKYEKQLDEFYNKHPEVPRQIEKFKDGKPKKPATPFHLYLQDQLKNCPDAEVENSAFKEQCRENWKKLPDEKKIIWIDLALEKEAKYQREVENYTTQNPMFVPATFRPVLTKEEKALKDRMSGKPVKPPSSAYSLFSTILLQSDEIKKVDPAKRMKFIADQWKSCTDEQKQPYVQEVNKLMKQYKQKMAVYSKSQAGQQEQRNLPPKRPNKDSKSEEAPKKKVKHEETVEVKNFEGEPVAPPISGFSLFRDKYKGEGPAKVAWRNLSKSERVEYEAQVQQLKQKYIKEYEKFLRSLSKKQLLAFSDLKRKSKQTDTSNGQEEKSEESSSCDNSSSEDESSDAATD